MAKKLFIWRNLYENPRIIEGKPADNKFSDTKINPRIIKTVNSKPANTEGRLYNEEWVDLFSFSLLLTKENGKSFLFFCSIWSREKNMMRIPLRLISQQLDTSDEKMFLSEISYWALLIQKTFQHNLSSHLIWSRSRLPNALLFRDICSYLLSKKKTGKRPT